MGLLKRLDRFLFGEKPAARHYDRYGGLDGGTDTFWSDSNYHRFSDWFSRLIDINQFQGDSFTYEFLSKLALKNPFGFSCTRKLKDALASIELEVYRTTRDGRQINNPRHSIIDLFRGPDGTRPYHHIIEQVVHHLHFGGELFIYMTIARSEGTMRPLSFDLISPARFNRFIRKGTNEPRGFKISRERYARIPQGGVVGYEFKSAVDDNVYGSVQTERSFIASVDNVIHVKCYNPYQPSRGLPIVTGCYDALVQAKMTALWNTNLGKTGGRIPGFFMPEGLKPGTQLTPQQRDQIERDFDSRATERQAKNRAMVMSGAMKFVEANVSPREAEFLKNDQYNGRKICAVFRTPPLLVGDVESVGLGGGSGTKSAEKSYYMTTVLPFLDCYLEELNYGIMSRFDDRYRIGYNRNKIEALQEELDKRDKRLAVACGGAFMTPNDARVAAGLEPLPDPAYDELREPGGKTGIEDVDEENPEDVDDDDDQSGRESNNNNNRLWVNQNGNHKLFTEAL